MLFKIPNEGDIWVTILIKNLKKKQIVIIKPLAMASFLLLFGITTKNILMYY